MQVLSQPPPWQQPAPAASVPLSRPSGFGNLYRLKVVGIPAGYSDEQLRQLFQLCGSAAEARIVHDKQSGRPVGYGYVSFHSKEAADLAISTFDGQLQLQGGATALSVYYAKKQHDGPPGGSAAAAADGAAAPPGLAPSAGGSSGGGTESCHARNAKLYFCGTPAGVRRDSILALFSAFGRVRHLQVYTDSYGVLSSGTVTMYATEEAVAAMAALDGKPLAPGTAPLKVTWAQLSTLPRRSPAGGGPPPPMPRGFTVSYACVPPAVTPAEIASAFERYGGVLQVVPFAHRREGPPNSRGCGLVVLEREAAALAAIEGLSGRHTWPGAERPLLVQMFYGAERSVSAGAELVFGSNSQPQQQQPGAGRPGGPHHHHHHGGSGPPPNSMPAAAAAGVRRTTAAFTYPLQQQQPQPQPPHGASSSSGGLLDAGGALPPPGCAPDAFKLVLTNLPASYSQGDVFALLQPYGNIVSLSLTPAGHGGAHDALATVWYATGGQADAALAALSNTVLMAAEGSRQLAVTAFKHRASLLAGQAHAALQQQHGAAGAVWGPPADAYAAHQQPSAVAALLHQQQHQLALASGGHDAWAAGGAGDGAGGMHMLAAGSQGQLAAATTSAMAANAFDMQQLLTALHGSQQPLVLDAPAPAGWPSAGAAAGSGAALSSGSGLDGSLLPPVCSALMPPLCAGLSGWLG